MITIYNYSCIYNLLGICQVAIPSFDDVAIQLCVLQVTAFKSIYLSLKVG